MIWARWGSCALEASPLERNHLTYIAWMESGNWIYDSYCNWQLIRKWWYPRASLASSPVNEPSRTLTVCLKKKEKHYDMFVRWCVCVLPAVCGRHNAVSGPLWRGCAPGWPAASWSSYWSASSPGWGSCQSTTSSVTGEGGVNHNLLTRFQSSHIHLAIFSP